MASANLILKRGDDFKVIVSLTTDGTALDLTNYTADAQVRATPDSVEILASFDVTINTPATAGIIEMVLTHDITADLTDGVWDLQLTRTTDDWITTVAGGTLTVTTDVTRLTP